MSESSSPNVGPSGDAPLIPLNLVEDQDSMESGEEADDATEGFRFALPVFLRAPPTPTGSDDSTSSSVSSSEEPANGQATLVEMQERIDQLEAALHDSQLNVERLETALVQRSEHDSSGGRPSLCIIPKPEQLQKLFLTSREFDDAIDYYDLNPQEQLRFDQSHLKYVNLVYIGPEVNGILVEKDIFDKIKESAASAPTKAKELMMAALRLDVIPLLSLPSSENSQILFAGVNSSLISSVLDDVQTKDMTIPERKSLTELFYTYVKQEFSKHRKARVIYID